MTGHSTCSSPVVFGLCLLWPNGRPSQQLLSSCFKLALVTFFNVINVLANVNYVRYLLSPVRLPSVCRL